MDKFFLVAILTCVLSVGPGSLTLSQEPSSQIYGTLFSVVVSGDQLVVWNTQVADSYSAIEYTANFSGRIPDSCGKRMQRCRAELFRDTESSRAVLVIPHSGGVALSLYDEVNTNNYTFVDQYIATTQERNDCNFASFIIDTKDNRLIVSCLQFTPAVVYEVNMWIYEVHVNFNSINESYLELLNAGNPYQSYSMGMSPIFFYDTDHDNAPFIIWFDDEVLFVAPLQFPHHQPVEYYADTIGHVCFGNLVTDIRQSSDRQRLLVYCSENTALEVVVSERASGRVPFNQTRTRFYCTDEWEQPYLEERNGSLVFVSFGSVKEAISHPLNLTTEYVGDCVTSNEKVWFIGSSTDGTILMLSVLENTTILLATNADTARQVVDNQILLFSTSNSSTVVNLACPKLTYSAIKESFLLSTFEKSQNYSCSGQVKQSTASDLSWLAAAIIPPLLIISCLILVVLLCLIMKRYLPRKTIPVQATGLDPPQSQSPDNNHPELVTGYN